MAKKKNGRNPRNTMESTDRKLIGNAFDDAIRFARKNSSHPNVPKIYDLVGPILKRRKAAVYNLLPEIRKRFGSLYENLGQHRTENCVQKMSLRGKIKI